MVGIDQNIGVENKNFDNSIANQDTGSGSSIPNLAHDSGDPRGPPSAATAQNLNEMQNNKGIGYSNTSKGKEKQSFASLFKDNRVPIEASLLHYVAPPLGKLIIGAEEIDSVEKTFCFCLVGYVMRTRPSPFAVINFLKGWGGNIKFLFRENGWIQFQFASESDRDRVLNGGYYKILGKQLFLKKIPSCFLFGKDDMEFVPTWVQIHGLPKQCWTLPVLIRIASITGKPIHFDVLTITKKGATYARVLVELDAKQDRIWDYEIQLPTGKATTVLFKYESDLKYCNKCHTLGHVTEMCGVYAKKKNHTVRHKPRGAEQNQAGHSDQAKESVINQDIPNDRETTSTQGGSGAGLADGHTLLNLQHNHEGQNQGRDMGKTSAGNDSVHASTLEPNEGSLGHGRTETKEDEDLFHDFGSNEFLDEDFEFDSEGCVDLLSRVEIQDKDEWKTVTKKNKRFHKNNTFKKGASSSHVKSGSSSMDTEVILVDQGSKKPVRGDGSRLFGNKLIEGRPPNRASGRL